MFYFSYCNDKVITKSTIDSTFENRYAGSVLLKGINKMANDQTTEDNAFKLHAALEQLESIVRTLENQDQPLDLKAALAQFEDGMKLSNQCQKTLAEVQQKVDILIGSDAGASTQAFSIDDA